MTDLPDSKMASQSRGQELTLVRAMWVVAALAAVGIFILALPGYLRPLEARPVQASAAVIATLNGIGLLASLAAAGVSLALAGLLFWRKPDDRMALYLSFFLLGYGIVMAGPIERLHWLLPGLKVDVGLAQATILTAPFVALFALFPNGRFVPGWMRWVTLGSLGFSTLYFLAPCCDYSTISPWLSGLVTVSGLTVLALVIYGQVYRYRQVSSPAERQQTKWVVYGLALFMVWAIVVTVPYAIAQNLPPEVPLPWWALLSNVGWWLSLTIIPLSLALSVLRYRLFEIDVIIKRTVQYALISGAGFIIYLLAVGGTSLFIQSNTQLIAGVIVMALLAIFFNPVRQRLQAVMDRLMPYTPPPPDVLAELERDASRAERDMRKVEALKQRPQARSVAPALNLGSSPPTRLTGRWAWVARLAWAVVFTALTVMYALGFLAVQEAFSTVCVDEFCTLRQQIRYTGAGEQVLGWPGPPIGYADRLRPDQVEALERLGLTLEQYSWLAALQMGLPMLVYLLIAAGLFWKKSDDWMVLFISVMVVTFPLQDMPLPFTLAVRQPIWEWIYVPAQALALGFFLIFPLIFPTGSAVPRWTRWMIGFELIGAIITVVLRNFILETPSVENILLVYLLVSFGTGVWAQLYRYFRVASQVERQQLKWVVVGLAGFIGTTFAVLGPLNAWLASPTMNANPAQALALSAIPDTLFRVISLFIPISIAISVLRYRLWGIDLVIKRTVQYTLISGASFVVYLLAVGGTSLFLQQRNDLVAGVIVLAFFIIFFNPARQRLQAVMDRLMPYTPPPPDVLAELEIQKMEREKRQLEKDVQHHTTADGTRLQGGWLTVARVAWVVSAILSLGMLLYSLPSGYVLLNTMCVNAVCEWGQLNPAGVRMLAELGLSVTAYALFFSGLITLMNLSYMVIGWFIFWRKSADRAALFISWAMVLAGTVDSGVVTFQHLYPTLFAPLALFRGAGYTCFFVLFIIFPNGQFVPRWSRWLILPVLAGQALAFLFIQTAPEVNSIFSAVWLTFGLGAQFYRYLRVSGPVERQQTKWVLVGFAATIVPFLVWPALAYVFPNIFSPFVNGVVVATVGDLVWWVFMLLGALLLPLGLAFSMFRYRLWEVDLVIRRTVQYAVITATGFVVYLLVVGGTSLFLQARNDLLAGGLALGAVVAAFVWLRPRLEAVMDKYAPLPPRPPEARPVVSSSKGGLQSEPIMNRPLSTFWQRLIRLGGAVLALNSLWAFSWTLFYTWELAHMPSPRIVEGLAALNLSTNLYFWANALPMALIFLSHFLVALVLFWRRPHDRMALFVAVFLMGLGGANAYPVATEYLRVWETGGLHYVIPFAIANFLGWPLLVAFFALYPDGVFVPGWMRYMAVYSFSFGVAWGVLPQVFGDPQGLLAIFVYGSVIAVFGSSFYAQVYRYRQHATPLQRQQIKWMVYGIAVITVVIVAQAATALLNPTPTPAESVQRELIFMPLNLAFVLLPIAVGLAIMRYRLFEIEIIVRRTAVYGAIVGGLGVAYFGGVALLQWLSQALTGPQSNFVVVLITLGIVALFNPVRRRFQILIDRAFYREKVDFREAFTAFAREVRTIIDLPELLRKLVNRTTELLHITHGAVYLGGLEPERIGELRLAEGRNLPEGMEILTLEATMLERLRGGHTISRPGHRVFPLLVPLIAPITPSSKSPVLQSLIGVLALGPRLSDQAYSPEDQTLLTSLADQAGTAVYVAQLIQEKQAETQRIEEAERRLESYANSPAGRAERFANSLISNTQSSLTELHAITQTAGTDPATAAMLEPLSAALTSLNASTLAGLADGYRYLFASQATPEVLPVGLRTLTDYLTQLDAPEALDLYRLCQRALEANSISAIVEQGTAIRDLRLDNSPNLQALNDLRHSLRELVPAADALRAYERVDAQQDKLAYLASAVERLTHADRAAQAELGAADRPIMQRIAANWLTVVTGAMSELQTRARLVCRLLTRHTWTGEVIAVSLAIRNEGRGAALNLKVALAPAPDYTLVDESVTIERLAAGEEAQAELRVRPHIGDKTGITGGQFRARFVIIYADPRGPDQTENFADVVYLLALEGEFKFIPNPYVVGTPLQTGSALFCGREDVFEFIQENLVAAHQNNLVLIGQRRTGKTSLLKQLPARLGEKYVSVYLDGQSLALDPGLPNFFYSLATEIAFALEDRGFVIGELPDFNDSPATTFERRFLASVRTALGDRHLLLLLDEFEELEGAVRRGNLDVSVFGFLRHMIQHSPNLSVIFCGTHRMEELAADYWSVLFNISLYRHVAFLQQAEAFKLIQEPVSGFGMKYDDLALDKMWRVTAGHPYFLQLLCHSLVNQHNKSKRNYVTVADVNAALDEILASGEAHFIFLWTESTREERLALTALSRMMPLTGQANPAQVSDYLAERGAPLDRRAVSEALHHLALRDTLRVNRDLNDSGGSETFSWQLGLLGLWVEKYKSLSRVVDEVRE